VGTEIPQVYMLFPTGIGEPPSWLKGFDAVYLEPGEVGTVIHSPPLCTLHIKIFPRYPCEKKRELRFTLILKNTKTRSTHRSSLFKMRCQDLKMTSLKYHLTWPQHLLQI